MKKLILLSTVIAVLAASFAHAQGSRGYQPRNAFVSSTNRMILPPVNPTNQTDWAALTTYNYGDIIKIPAGHVSGSRTTVEPLYFWCTDPTPGASGGTVNEPLWVVNHTNAADIVDSAITWRWVHPVRNAFTIVNISNTNIFIGYGRPAQSQEGITLLKDMVGVVQSGYSRLPAFQGSVWAISDDKADYSYLSIQEE